jgi:hypothetical protein
MLVVLSPDAVESKYVTMEYRHAIRTDKVLIPLLYQHIERGPMDLNDIQWIDFQNAGTYNQSLTELLKALALVVPHPAPMPHVAIPAVPMQVGENAEPDLVAIRPAPAPPDQDTLQLFNAGIVALGENDPDRAAIFW